MLCDDTASTKNATDTAKFALSDVTTENYPDSAVPLSCTEHCGVFQLIVFCIFTV